MPLPKTIKPAAQYAITVLRPVQLPDGAWLLPSSDEIIVSGEVLKAIKDGVTDAIERSDPEPAPAEPVSDLVRQLIGGQTADAGGQAASEPAGA